MELVLGFLPFLVFLTCPLMMAFCYFGMRKTGCSTAATAPATEQAPAILALPRTEQVAALQAQLSQLQTEQAAIARQIAGLAVDEDQATTDSVLTAPLLAGASPAYR